MALVVPVSFQLDGVRYHGTLESVCGTGNPDVFHLMVGNYYWGRLRKAQDQWAFDAGKRPELAKYTPYFTMVTQAAISKVE